MCVSVFILNIEGSSARVKFSACVGGYLRRRKKGCLAAGWRPLIIDRAFWGRVRCVPVEIYRTAQQPWAVCVDVGHLDRLG